ncbi:MAG: hypothetical protein ACI8QC_002193 [Planctomycetota bacterium]
MFPQALAQPAAIERGDNLLQLIASDLPINQFSYFLTSATQGFVPNPGASQGNLCLLGTLGRFVTQVPNSGNQGQFSMPVDLSSLPAPLGVAVMAGETWNF